MKEYPKECPFCHSLPDIVKNPLWDGTHGYPGKYEYYIACKNKDCKVKPRTYKYDNIYDMSEQECIEKAISDWNNR